MKGDDTKIQFREDIDIRRYTSEIIYDRYEIMMRSENSMKFCKDKENMKMILKIYIFLIFLIS